MTVMQTTVVVPTSTALFCGLLISAAGAAFVGLVAAAPTSTTLGSPLRSDFPILDERIDGKPLVYFDNAASSHMPKPVLEAIERYYQHQHSNVHRGAHTLALRATEAFESARSSVAAFLNARRREEIVFTSGATEGINLVAQTWGEANIGEGDEIILSVMEHHSNIVPWQLLAKRKGATIKYIQMDENECLDMSSFESLLSPRTKMVGIVAVSNTLGCSNPIAEIVRQSHAVGAKVLVDACQAVPHKKIDVNALDCDWLVASGHKMMGPTGIGVLYGKYEVLESMPPWMGGGEMIEDVYFDHSTYLDPPSRFEAGTPPIAQAVALGAAVDYLNKLGMDNIAEYEKDVSSYLYRRLGDIPDLRLYGPDPIAQGHSRAALVAFNHDNIHASDLSTFLDQEGIAVRAGHHCTQPLHRLLGAAGSIRASLYVYNTRQEIDCFIDALHRVIQMFSDIPEAPGIDLGFAALGMEGLSLLTAGEMGPNDEGEGEVME
ncbi:unnamed protein product [Vitrella brassicaformis CCMP3155]|uniref:cysteine desulfurase n=1 Tax=Vitrella brassicaformis (strain CCMP3155) TaxID=1169540 RepID=A0A0G4EC25_VITBC|nr:unnamed protein product [Vitrella brassicaformis CCMP3155]|eukprot:CEL93231.1 unnamed protein product [Vitrella brassicaformis CCMP3155]